jgi:hypothetical protein
MSAVSEKDQEEEEATWRVALDEVGEDDDDPERIEPETPTPENAVFVALGVALTLLVFYAAVASL